MADKMLDVKFNAPQISKLKNKLSKYGPYAIQEGLKAANDYLNTDSFKLSMEPPEQTGKPFQWSSDLQSKAFFASDGFGGGIPHVRTHELMLGGTFVINEGSLSIEYQNEPYAKFVIEPPYQIIGHQKRGWKSPNFFVVKASKDIVKIFKEAALNAWEKMESFMFGGGGGL